LFVVIGRNGVFDQRYPASEVIALQKSKTLLKFPSTSLFSSGSIQVVKVVTRLEVEHYEKLDSDPGTNILDNCCSRRSLARGGDHQWKCSGSPTRLSTSTLRQAPATGSSCSIFRREQDGSLGIGCPA
jgi:hypothetical protein